MEHLLKIKCVDSRMNVHILASASVTFTLTTVQVPILALTHKKTDNSAGSWLLEKSTIVNSQLPKS
jgi:hypothetical protein